MNLSEPLKVWLTDNDYPPAVRKRRRKPKWGNSVLRLFNAFYLGLRSLTVQGTVVLVFAVAFGTWTVSWFGEREVTKQAAESIAVRLDRATRTAAAIVSIRAPGEFTVTRDGNGQPLAYQVVQGRAAEKLQPSMVFDVLVEDIARVNQRYVHLFRYDPEARQFVRIATSMRGPDGAYVREVRFDEQHPAFASLVNLNRFTGEVPQPGGLRMADLVPVLGEDSTIAGALAVDVGWVDSLWKSTYDLKDETRLVTALIMILLTLLGGGGLFLAMRPLRQLARYARAVAGNSEKGAVPYLGRGGEIGALAAGMAKVVEMRGRLEKLAFFDPITGKPNRTRLEMLLESALDEARDKRSLSLIQIGIDQFRSVNDTFGHVIGDALLRQVAQALGGELGARDILARVSADEFVIVAKDIDNSHDAQALAQRCISRLDRAFVLPQSEIYISASAGIVTVPREVESAAEALRDAGLALHRAKSQGRRQIVVISATHRAEAQRSMELHRELHQAIGQKQLLLHFQPQIVPETMKLYGVEALVRWDHPEQGLISPGEFIPVAEDSGLIVELGRFVLDEACRTARLWLDCGIAFRHISVNISPIQLWQPKFDRQVARMLAKHGVPAECLCLEVTESVFINRETERVVDMLQRLSRLGVILSLDDFGTGYSSLGYLREMPFQQLKVDRCFIHDANTDPKRANLLAGIIALARGLDLQVVAEGVETEGELALLRSLGCKAVQGYYYARPVPALLLPLEVERLRNLDPAGSTAKKPDLKIAN